LLAQFPDDNASKTYLAQRRWPDGVACPKCGNVKVWHVTHRPFHWICKQCDKNGYRFSVITETIFENTKYPLSEWFKVILIMSQSKKGTSALQIQRMLGMGSYRTKTQSSIKTPKISYPNSLNNLSDQHKEIRRTGCSVAKAGTYTLKCRHHAGLIPNRVAVQWRYALKSR
jgi:transposase-like zinc ribbon protein